MTFAVAKSLGASMSLETVISRFGTFVRSLYSETAGPEVPFPVQLEPVRGAIEHHLVPLIMVGRSDHELLRAERDAIVDHCRTVLRRRDKLLSPSEITTLEIYVDRFAPSLSQLDALLPKFAAADADDIADLLAAADRVILADDVVREEERAQLAEIKKQFDQVRTAPR
jgi:hypothetical protein